ncbi:MAG TPA: hypothetical protein VGE52_14600, partial [Pirellulales bacterium]
MTALPPAAGRLALWPAAALAAIGFLCPLAPLTAADAPSAPAATAESSETSAVEQGLSRSLHYLASDDLEGRGPGTKGISLAAEYIAEQFKAIGLKTDVYEGSPYHKFDITVGAHLGPVNTVAFSAPAPAEGS